MISGAPISTWSHRQEQREGVPILEHTTWHGHSSYLRRIRKQFLAKLWAAPSGLDDGPWMDGRMLRSDHDKDAVIPA